MRPLSVIVLLVLLSLPGWESAAQSRGESRRPPESRPRELQPQRAPRSAPREQPRYLQDVWREVSPPPGVAQDTRKPPPQSKLRVPQPERFQPDVRQTRQDGYRTIFASVQDGLGSGDVRSFSHHMGSQVYINLRGGESGYYSANQAYYVIESYLKTRKLVNLNFSTIGESDARPYATGSAGLVVRGNKEIAQVYVSLSQIGEKWIITQINIY